MMNSLKLQPAVSFFPTPLPDELLDSVIYRYHHLSGNSHPAHTIEAFYGQAGTIVPKLLTNGIRRLHARLPKALFASADDLIHQVTMVPAFGAVLDERQMGAVRQTSMEVGSLGQNVLYRGANRVMHSQLHCCPICVGQELEKFGTAYWHRSHQLYGVKVCHEHGCDLIAACPYCDAPLSRQGSMDLPRSHCSACNKPFLAVFSQPAAVQEIAILGKAALSGVVPYCDRQWLGGKVRHLAGSDTQGVCDRIRELFGPDYLSDDPQDGFYTFQGDWLGNALKDRNTIRGPERGWLNLPSLMHMMVLVHTLFGTWEKVISPRARRALAA